MKGSMLVEGQVLCFLLRSDFLQDVCYFFSLLPPPPFEDFI